MIDIANWIFAASLFIVTFRKKAMRLIRVQLDCAPDLFAFLAALLPLAIAPAFSDNSFRGREEQWLSNPTHRRALS